MNLNLARLATLALSTTIAASSFAALTPYSQNFEGLNIAAPNALSDDGWKVFGNVFDNGNYVYGYGPFGAPNGGGGFSAVATGEGGPAQGSQYLNTYNDYNNGDHNNPARRIEANIFQERTIAAADLGKTYDFKFDYKASSQNGPSGQTVAQAFIKVLNPSAGFSLVAFPTFNTTSASTTAWGTQTLSITIDNAWTGHIFQFGFMSTANSFQSSGVYYDNINFGQAVPEPATLAALGVGALVAMRRRKKA